MGQNCLDICEYDERLSESYLELPVSVKEIHDSLVVDVKWYTQMPQTKWEKKKSLSNCLSDDPDDCLVWCLMELPAQYEQIRVLKSVSAIDSSQWEWKRFYYPAFEKKQNLSCDALCNKQLTKELIMAIARVLNREDYDIEADHAKNDRKFRKRLKQYQKDYKLPTSKEVNLLTLVHMGILPN